MRNGERTGRPAGSKGGNKERILEAARAEFAAKGFRGTTMRSIATGVGLDVALLSHYFGNKEGLFAATMELPEEAQDILTEALSGPFETQGERLTRGYLGLWENPATGPQMQVLARSVLGNEAATERMRTLVTGAITGPGVTPLITDRQSGFALAMTQLVGVAFARYLAHIPQLAELDFETLVARTAPAVQLHLGAADD
ncbi:TetR family transcriptional regulator [Nocardiopsis terrae]|uniref:AcrR family transcriptional regulator n=1 Tax=Nocardiopsis terrae TaxID=372655 RepID=A0ABR9HH35_9ACTN|nr:TetR family transcriptional regulator [Nocardiopsis terrae]MBE1458341.1 AcrR family transcriptional regulator [Nocardiopsis terrae]GHC81035.1 TetR family transcriptional regulator [Nocardiopsis terrae]